MDTFKDRQGLERLYADGNAPWELWKTAPLPQRAPSTAGGTSSGDGGDQRAAVWRRAVD